MSKKCIFSWHWRCILILIQFFHFLYLCRRLHLIPFLWDLCRCYLFCIRFAENFSADQPAFYNNLRFITASVRFHFRSTSRYHLIFLKNTFGYSFYNCSSGMSLFSDFLIRLLNYSFYNHLLFSIKIIFYSMFLYTSFEILLYVVSIFNTSANAGSFWFSSGFTNSPISVFSFLIFPDY